MKSSSIRLGLGYCILGMRGIMLLYSLIFEGHDNVFYIVIFSLKLLNYEYHV